MSGTSRIISAPVDWWCVCVFSLFSHCRFSHDMSKAFPRTKPVCEEKQNKKTILQPNPPRPHRRDNSLKLFLLKNSSVIPTPKEKRIHSFTHLSTPPWRRALSLAAPLLQLGPNTPPGMAFFWHQGADTVSASLHPTPLTCLIKSALFFFRKKKKERKKKKTFCQDTLCRRVTVQISRL